MNYTVAKMAEAMEKNFGTNNYFVLFENWKHSGLVIKQIYNPKRLVFQN